LSGDEKMAGGNQGSDKESVSPAELERKIDDINVWAIVRFAIGLLILGIISYIGLYGLLRLFEHERLAAEAPPPSMTRTAEERLPPPPRLQMMPGSPSEHKTPEYEMTAMLEEENTTLNSYGWVDKNAGVVRIPISDAMKLLLEKGVAMRPSPAAQSGTGSNIGGRDLQ
jgi:hypothetical protein